MVQLKGLKCHKNRIIGILFELFLRRIFSLKIFKKAKNCIYKQTKKYDREVKCYFFDVVNLILRRRGYKNLISLVLLKFVFEDKCKQNIRKFFYKHR